MLISEYRRDCNRFMEKALNSNNNNNNGGATTVIGVKGELLQDLKEK